MAEITMAQAKRDFENGLIIGAEIVQPGMSAGVWCVAVRMAKGCVHSGLVWLVDARTHEVREFRTLDAAFSALEQIGFKSEVLKVA